jgi:hypothetical protein
MSSKARVMPPPKGTATRSKQTPSTEIHGRGRAMRDQVRSAVRPPRSNVAASRRSRDLLARHLGGQSTHQ